MTRKLTLDYGLRGDYGTYQVEQFGRYASFSPNVRNPSAGGRLDGEIYEATCNCIFAKNYPYAIGQRLGVAYQIDKKTVIRGGFGVVYNATSPDWQHSQHCKRQYAGLRADYRAAIAGNTVHRSRRLADFCSQRGPSWPRPLSSIRTPADALAAIQRQFAARNRQQLRS